MADGGPATRAGVRDEVNVCHLCGALNNLSLCGGCRGTWYCCKAHQRQDWKDHKRSCRRGRAPEKKSLSDMPNESVVDDTTDVDSVAADDIGSNPTSPLKVLVDDASGTPHARSFEQINADDGTANLETSGLAVSPADGSVVTEACDGGSNQPYLLQKHNHVKSSKKKHKSEQQRNLATISEDGPPPERYYLDYSTHRINLPSSAKTAISGNSQPSAMGQGDNKLSALQTKDQYLTILRSRFVVLAKYVVDCLTKYGICVIDKFLGDVTGHEILKEVLQVSSAGVMKQGQLVHGPSSSSNKYIRGDMITWVDGTEPRSENIHFLISCMDAVMLQCASKLDMYTINERTKVSQFFFHAHLSI